MGRRNCMWFVELTKLQVNNAIMTSGVILYTLLVLLLEQEGIIKLYRACYWCKHVKFGNSWALYNIKR